MTRDKKLYLFLIIAVIISIIGFLSVWLINYWPLIQNSINTPNFIPAISSILSSRFIQLLGIIVSVLLVTTSSLSFQTISNNRILTPSILGFDAIFIITQTLLVFIFGGVSILVVNEYINFLISLILMILVIGLMFLAIFKKNKNNIVLLLLLGLVITAFANSFANFLQVFMDPIDFTNVLSLTTVNINAINEGLVLIMIPITIILMYLFYRENKYYDVIALGEEQAINLGINYTKKVNLSIFYITISIAISTALVGPLSFLGLVVINTARELFKTNKHKTLMIASSLVSIIIILGGQFILELFKFKTPVTVLVNLIGGLYLIYILVKENVR